MPLTKVSFSVIQVANNVTSKTVGNTTSIPSITFDQNGVITAVSNNTINLNSVTGDLAVSGNTTTNGTGFTQIASGTTAQRPVSPVSGQLRYNSTTGNAEVYLNTGWWW